jgi:hypothetical protein
MAVIRRTLHQSKIPLGKILTPIPDFTGMSPNNAARDMFVGMMDPLGSGKKVIVNKHLKAQPDTHATMSIGRLAAGMTLDATMYAAFDWCYLKPADLPQTGRNLFFQTQMFGSPVDAISTTSGRIVFVWRNPTSEHRDTLGAIPWGHRMHFVVGQKIAKSGGFVACWYAVDGDPDVDRAPLFSHVKLDTWQGAEANNTMGQYAEQTDARALIGNFLGFGRDTSPTGALAAYHAA